MTYRVPTIRFRSIPAVDSIAGDETLALELDRLARLNEQQSLLEKVISGGSFFCNMFIVYSYYLRLLYVKIYFLL